MRRIGGIILIIIILLSGVWYVVRNSENKRSNQTTPTDFFGDLLQNVSEDPTISNQDVERVSVFAEGLDVPWAIAFLPEGDLLVTEREGRVRFVSKNGEVQSEPVTTISSVKQTGEGGLHGIALHPSFAKASEGKPDFSENGYVYLYYTYSGNEWNTLNRVVRYRYNGTNLKNEEIIVDAIPGASNHDGGRIKFGPDGFLYITTGDAQEPSLAQDTDSLAGKILRVTDDGNPAQGNPFGSAQGKPFGNERVYSYGHRNPQGITWDANGQLWETEHGPSGSWPNCCQDEFNRVEIGKNYGWPESVGDTVRAGTVGPVLHSGQSIWAPAGVAFVNGKFYFAGLRGTALYEVTVNGNNAELKTHFKNEYGRLREVIMGPDGMLYVTTSNRDGRGSPKSGDDKILKINPQKL